MCPAVVAFILSVEGRAVFKRTRNIFIVVAFASLGGQAIAQLPICPEKPAYWTDCFGTRIYSNGHQYSGEWQLNNYNGKGHYKHPKWGEYIGEWKNNRPDGRGMESGPAGEVRSGIWSGGSFVKASPEVAVFVSKITVEIATAYAQEARQIIRVDEAEIARMATKKMEEERRVATEKMEEERQTAMATERVRIETVNRLEAERIAREGDGSADDIACQKQNLKPSTPAYLKCRDLIDAQRKKVQADLASAEEKRRQAEEAKAARQAELAVQAEKRRAEQQARSDRQLGISPGDTSVMAMAKRKCADDLGFKPATEGFGKCVLQLSK